MATNLDVIKRALKKIHVLPSGMNPSSAQTADAMAALSGMLTEFVTIGTFGRLYDVIADEDVTAREWTRIRCAAGVDVTLPTTITQQIANSWPWEFSSYGGDGPDYGWYYQVGWDVYPRPPFDMAPIVVVDSAGVETVSMYNASTGAWVTINGLDASATFPLNVGWVEGFAAMLAERLADEYSRTLGAATTQLARNCRSALSSRFGSLSRRGGSPANYF